LHPLAARFIEASHGRNAGGNAMDGTERLNELRQYGRMHWIDGAQAWRAEPDDVMNALAACGFEECKREVARMPGGPIAGGVWQGVDPRTGAVASTIWSRESPTQAPIIFIHINGHPLKGTD
jgi:hypothetical protein